MLNNEIMDEIIFLSNQNKIIDKNIIKKIINSVIIQSDDITRKKYNGVWFIGLDFSQVAATIDVCNIIVIDYEKIKEILKIYLNNGLGYLKSNLLIVQILLHEIEHLKEEYKISVSNDLESYIIKSADIKNFKPIATIDTIKQLGLIKTIINLSSSSKKDKLINQIYDLLHKRQMKAYDCDPYEKIAELDSMKTLIESCYAYPDFVKKNSALYNSLLDIYFDRFMLGYEENNFGYNIPIIDFFTIMGDTKYLYKIDTYSKNSKIFLKRSIDKYDSQTRLRLGLPAVREDFLEVQRKIKNRKKNLLI